MTERVGIPFLESLRASVTTPEKANLLAQLIQEGAPSRRNEDYRYSDMGRLRQLENVSRESAPDLSAIRNLLPAVGNAFCLVLVNGRLEKDLSRLPEKGLALQVSSKMDPVFSRPSDDFVTRLAQVMANEQVSLDCTFAEGDQNLVHLLFLSTTTEETTAISSPTVSIRLRKGAQLQLVQRHLGSDGRALTLSRTRIRLEDGATCQYAYLPEGGEGEYVFSHVQVEVAASARWTSLSGASGKGFARQSLNVDLLGPASEGVVNGAYLMEASGHCEFHTTVHHRHAESFSRQLYKGVLKDRSRGVFRGRVVIDPNAQKVMSSQLNKTLLLSDAAEIDTLPQLEIHADDVKASHGATVGDLKYDEIFYLVSRGIPEATARRMLTDGFVREVNPFPMSLLGDQVDAWMDKMGVQ